MKQSRTQARSAAVQALYQWHVTGQTISDIQQQFSERSDVSKGQLSYFNELLLGVPRQVENIDSELKEFVDREIKLIDPVELAILRLGVYELIYRHDVPYRVILNEGINLAKCFGATDGHKYVNGILDKIACSLRASEIDSYHADRKPVKKGFVDK